MDKSDDDIISFGPPLETSSPIPDVTAYETIETMPLNFGSQNYKLFSILDNPFWLRQYH